MTPQVFNLSCLVRDPHRTPGTLALVDLLSKMAIQLVVVLLATAALVLYSLHKACARPSP